MIQDLSLGVTHLGGNTDTAGKMHFEGPTSQPEPSHSGSESAEEPIAQIDAPGTEAAPGGGGRGRSRGKSNRRRRKRRRGSGSAPKGSAPSTGSKLQDNGVAETGPRLDESASDSDDVVLLDYDTFIRSGRDERSRIIKSIKVIVPEVQVKTEVESRYSNPRCGRGLTTTLAGSRSLRAAGRGIKGEAKPTLVSRL